MRMIFGLLGLLLVLAVLVIAAKKQLHGTAASPVVPPATSTGALSAQVPANTHEQSQQLQQQVQQQLQQAMDAATQSRVQAEEKN